MALDSGKNNSKKSPLHIISVIFASSGAIAWFFIVQINFRFFFQQVTNNQSAIFQSAVIFYTFGAFSTLITAIVSSRVDRKKLLLFSITLGTLSTGLLVFLHGELVALILASLMGLSFGLQYPSGMALFVDRTSIENRGKYSGILVFATFTLILLGNIGVDLQLGLLASTALLAIVRATSYLTLATDTCNRQKITEESFISILRRRDFILYLIPWIIFILASGLSNFVYPGLPKTSDFNAALTFGSIFQFLDVAVFSLTSGFITDHYGRKQPVIIGIVIFGVSFAILGLAPSPLTVMIESAVFGIAWGFCMVAFFLIPGDLSLGVSNEKYYALNAVLPFITFTVTGTFPIIMNVSAPVGILSPVLSVLLFLSVIPVLYAPETLPESVLRFKKFQDHLRKVEKVIQEAKKER